MRLEINTTYECNATCRWCNRLVGVADIPGEITPEQLRRAIDTLNEQRVKVTLVTLAGGEPFLNPHYQGLLDELPRLKWLRLVRCLTNAVDTERQKQYTFPNVEHITYRWVPAPLDDHTGKDKHTPFLISPADLNIQASGEHCSVRGYCGRGLDAFGFSMCGVAGVLGRLLQINPYDPVDPVIDYDDNICRHCIYGLPRAKQREIIEQTKTGDIKHPTQTYREGLRQYRQLAEPETLYQLMPSTQTKRQPLC